MFIGGRLIVVAVDVFLLPVATNKGVLEPQGVSLRTTSALLYNLIADAGRLMEKKDLHALAFLTSTLSEMRVKIYIKRRLFSY